MSASYCVFDYSNYRSFLRVSYEAKKRENPLWSYQVWANKIGLSSGTTLSKILQGHRDPGPTATSRLCDYFGFDDEEREYFEDLVKLHKVQNDPRLSLVIVKRLNRRSKGESNIRILSQDEFEMISKYGLNESKCWVVGDKWSDSETGLKAGMRGALVRTGKPIDRELEALAKKRKVPIYKDLREFLESEIIVND